MSLLSFQQLFDIDLCKEDSTLARLHLSFEVVFVRTAPHSAGLRVSL